MRVAIVGSGPAGIAAAKALNGRDVVPTILDAGETLDADRASAVARMRASPVAAWSSADTARVTENATAEGGGIPLKLAYGSDYVYGRGRDHSPYDAAGVGLWPTFARGGYSTVWGAAVQPAHDDDLGAWPFRRAALDEGYAAILKDLPYATEPGPLDRDFSLPGVARPIPCGRQGRSLIERLDARGEALARSGVRHGRSRLMARAADDDKGLGCVSCGLCLTGCPKGAIWSAEDELVRMIAAGTVRYEAPVVVRRISESADGVTVETDRGPRGFDFVFLGAGALGTTRILLESLGLFDTEVRLKNSQKMLVPVLSRWRARGAMAEAVPTLAAAFLEAKVPGLGANWMHVQVSGVNNLVLRRLGIDPAAPGLRGLLLRPAVERLMICWAGLHSDHSAEIALTLRREASGGSTLTARPRPHPAERDNFRLAGRALFGALRLAGAYALLPSRQIAEPGNGGHFGGGFPMRAAPRGRLESDSLGRPSGFARVFAVDATVLPTIPATPPTLTVMANAWRIAHAAPLVPASPT